MEPDDKKPDKFYDQIDKSIDSMPNEIDHGNKDVDFDELIVFTHSFLNYRICSCITKDTEPFGLLITNNEFIMAGNTTFDESSFSGMNNKQNLDTISEKAKAFSGSEPPQKANFIETIPDYAKQIGFQSTVELLFPILLKVPNERDSVIDKFLSVFKKIVAFFALHKEEGYKMIRDHMIPLIDKIIQKKKNDDKIIKLCSDALLDVVKYIKDEDKGPTVLAITITLAHYDDEKDKDKCKIIAAQLQNDLAPFIGRDLCEMWIVPQIGSFADDHVSHVRKAVLKNFMKISETVSFETFKSRILPVYEKLARDSLWLVRKAAAEILPQLTKLCDSATISAVLLPLYKAFASDSKNYVKYTAVEIFGQFITLLNAADRTDDLLEYYINIVNDINFKEKEDLTMACQCAYNFPAVLFAYGKDKWPRLKPCFDKFAQENNDKIKGPIASALGEIAKIVGSEITERDLLVYVSKFFNDPKLQAKILGVLPDIVRSISPAKKTNYLENLKVMISDKEKWRKRMEYARIIGQFNQIYSEDILYKRVFPIALNFCFDEVAKVRFKSAKYISKMFLQMLSTDTEFKKKAMNILMSFAQSFNYHHRQLFIRMCHDLYANEELFSKEIIDYVYDLAYDDISNVRMTLAKCLARILKEKNHSWILENEKMLQILNALKNDKTMIVSDYLKDYEVKKVDVVPHEIPNGKFVNMMELITVEFGIQTKNPKNVKITTNKTTTAGPTPTPTPTPKPEDNTQPPQVEPQPVVEALPEQIPTEHQLPVQPEQPKAPSNDIENDEDNKIDSEDKPTNDNTISSEEKPSDS